MASMANPEKVSKACKPCWAKVVTIETDQPQAIQGDGELWDPIPVKVSIRPGAKRVLVQLKGL